ncbi:MAG: OmpH family outer membrane protein [Bacteroidales bacterium]|jgi:outer membrane protein|nr:OmpH family outer membrane protein [Bacteroidales bacterium]
MKRVILTAAVAMLMGSVSFAQKFAHVDTEYILGKIPAYQQAQTKLDTYSKQWQAEVEAKFAELDEMYKKFQAEADILPAATKNKREDEIIAKEKEAKELQKKYFGTNGELATKRQELIKPIQDNVYNALKSVATEGGYDYIFDKVTGDIIYASEKYDESDVVLKKIVK